MFSLLAMKKYSPKKVFSDKPPVNWSHSILRRHDCECSWLIKTKLIMSAYLFYKLNVHNMSYFMLCSENILLSLQLKHSC